MKNAITKSLVLSLALSAFGCSQSSSSNGDSSVAAAGVYPTLPTLPGTPGTPGTTLPGTTNAVPFTPVSLTELAYYSGHQVVSPGNFTVTVNLNNDGGNRFYGGVAISYTDVDGVHSANFQSGTGTNVYFSGSDSNGVPQYAYNVWFNYGGTSAFSGYFEDVMEAGSVVLVVDTLTGGTASENGTTAATLSGSIWYKNFPITSAPHSPYRYCWFIENGPYDCRSSAVMYKNSIYPTDTYRKLGSFTGLPKSLAFH